MTSYFDSSALVAIYVTEAFSRLARREARAVSQLPYTVLHDLEVRTALQLLLGRGRLDAREVQGLLGLLEEDIEVHRLVETRVDLFEVFRRATDLSKAHAATLLCRSLDILHVAVALQLRCHRFVSGDDRQLALAKTLGLNTVDVKRSRRERR